MGRLTGRHPRPGRTVWDTSPAPCLCPFASRQPKDAGNPAAALQTGISRHCVLDEALPCGRTLGQRSRTARQSSCTMRGVPSGRGDRDVAKPQDGLTGCRKEHLRRLARRKVILIRPVGQPGFQRTVRTSATRACALGGAEWCNTLSPWLRRRPWPDCAGRLRSRNHAPAGLPVRARRIRGIDRVMLTSLSRMHTFSSGKIDNPDFSDLLLSPRRPAETARGKGQTG